MLHQKLHKHIKKHAKRMHKHIQEHGHKRISFLGIAFLVVLVYPYFSNAQTPESCENGATNAPACDVCAEGYFLDETQQCVEIIQEPENCPNQAIDFPTCATCAEGYILDENQQCVEDQQEPVLCPNGAINPTACDVCAEGYTLDENQQCVEDQQEPTTCENGATNAPTCDVCTEGYELNENQECVQQIIILGCTDPESINYDMLATQDDGSCISLLTQPDALTGTVTYSPSTSTTGTVVATVTGFSTTGVTITSTGGATHTFTGNGSFTFTFSNTQGSTGSAVATVSWITGTIVTPPTTGGCDTGSIIINQPISGAVLSGEITISWSSSNLCTNILVLPQLLDHNHQWINMWSGGLPASGEVYFVSTTMAEITGMYASGLYTLTGLHLSGTSREITNGSGIITSSGIYTVDTPYTIYTGTYNGLYTNYATGYKLRLIDPITQDILSISDGTFTIDNRKPTITNLLSSFSNVVSGSIGRPSMITVSLTSDEALSGASFTILGTNVSASTGTQSGTIYTYTVPMQTVANTGAVVFTAHVADLAGNITDVYGTSAVIFDNYIPKITNFSLTGSTGSIGLGWKTDVNTLYTISYYKTGATPTVFNSTVYGTMHNYTMTNIQNNNTYIFNLTARDVLGNSKAMSGDVRVSNTGALQLSIYQDNGNLFQLSEQVEVDLYNEILKREIEKFQTCKAKLTINEQTIQIGNKNVKVKVPVIHKNSVKNVVEAFLLFFINKAQNTTLSQVQLDDVVGRMNDFFVVLTLLEDDTVSCEQTMSNYYVTQFQRAMQTTLNQ